MCKARTIASKNTFFIKPSILGLAPKSPIQVPWRSQTLGALGDLQDTSLERRVPPGYIEFYTNTLKLDTLFTTSENSKYFDPYRPIVNVTDEVNLKRSDKYVALSSLTIYYTWKLHNKHNKVI